MKREKKSEGGGQDSELPALKICPDCCALPGRMHEDGCDVEQCSVCGSQRICCNCAGHDKAFARWTGIWPGAAEAQYLGCDLNEFHIAQFNKIFFVKPGSVPEGKDLLKQAAAELAPEHVVDKRLASVSPSEVLDKAPTIVAIAYVQFFVLQNVWVAKIKIGKYTYRARSAVNECSAVKHLLQEVIHSRIPSRITMRRGAPADKLPDVKGEAAFYTFELWEGGAE